MTGRFSPERIGWFLALIVAMLLPLFVGEYLTSILLLIAIWSIVARDIEKSCSSLNGVGAPSAGVPQKSSTPRRPSGRRRFMV